MYLKLIFSVLIINLVAPGCQKPGCIGNAGPASSRTATLSPFTELQLNDNISLVLIQGNTNEIRVTGPANVINGVSYNIVAGKLIISNNNSCRWARDPDEVISVQLTFTELNKLEYEGSGDVTNIDTLRCDGLQIESKTGAGNIELTVDNKYTGVFIHLENAAVKLHGRSERCNTYTNSRGLTDLSNLVVKKMAIEYEGLADTYIHVTEELDAILYYKGNIFYKGNPVITGFVRYSTGNLIARP